MSLAKRIDASVDDVMYGGEIHGTNLFDIIRDEIRNGDDDIAGLIANIFVSDDQDSAIEDLRVRLESDVREIVEEKLS